MRVPARRDPFLLLASGAALALLVTVTLLPGAPWRMPLAVLGGLWAPGYALVALVWRPGALSKLERHALAAAAGLLLAPVVALATSEAVGFGPTQVASALALVTLAGTLLARRDETAEPATASLVPSTRVTLGASGAALVFAAILVAPSFAASSLPHSLALTAPDGGQATLRWTEGSPPTWRILASGGDEAVEAPLTIRWDNVTLFTRALRLGAGEAESFEVRPPADAAPGNHTLAARWAGRDVHAYVHIQGATA